MHARIFVLFFLIFRFILPPTLQAKVITVNNVSVQVQTLSDSSFQWLFKFALPPLPARVNIDYAVTLG